MDSKSKAEQLIKKFYNPIFTIDLGRVVLNDHKRLTAAKQCALIAVDALIKETMLHDLTPYQHSRTGYWLEVKQELEKL